MSDGQETTVYAGFWWRVLAAIVDAILLSVINGIIAFTVGMEGMMSDVANGTIHVGVSGYTSLVELLYFPLFESSRLRATPGKLACGIVVVDEAGRQLTFLRAFGRNIAKLLSALILFVGFLMAGWTRRKQALHDMIAGCLVLRRYNPGAAITLPDRA